MSTKKSLAAIALALPLALLLGACASGSSEPAGSGDASGSSDTVRIGVVGAGALRRALLGLTPLFGLRHQRLIGTGRGFVHILGLCGLAATAYLGLLNRNIWHIHDFHLLFCQLLSRNTSPCYPAH